LGIQQVFPLNLAVDNFVPDLETRTINATVNWIPPFTSSGPVETEIVIYTNENVPQPRVGNKVSTALEGSQNLLIKSELKL